MRADCFTGLAERLFPICRSITGPGLRATLAILQEIVPLEIRSVFTGTKVLDWEIPDEWSVRDAWIKNSAGEKLVDFSENNLHLLQYSIPFRGKVSRAELEEHLYSLPAQPDSIPYKTSYYQKKWGFCLAEITRQKLWDSYYEVCVDTSLEPGVLNYGEYYLPGAVTEEILVSAHICHPSLANDNLSGILVALACAEAFSKLQNYYSLRFVFAPGTIGAIAWLAENFQEVDKIKHGLVLTGLGAGDVFHFKKTRAGDSVLDQMVAQTLDSLGLVHEILPFSPYGYDERQYNSPGFSLPVGCLMRNPFGSYPEYHTSADNLNFLRADYLVESFDLVQTILSRLNQNRVYRNLFPFGEPQLGKRGLYASTPEENMAVLWILNLSDGNFSLLEICQRSGIAFEVLQAGAEKLLAGGVLELVR